MSLPKITDYPVEYDNDFNLKTVVDGLYSKTVNEIRRYDRDDPLSYDWDNGEGRIILEDALFFPNSGYITVYLEGHYGKASERATAFHYTSKNENTLEGVSILSGQSIKFFPIGSVAVQNVVAENHNYNKNSILALERYLGNRGTEDRSTIEWFTEFYVHTIRVPKPWLSIDPLIAFVGDYITFKDLTSRINPGFTDAYDTTVEWNFQLGDGTTINVKIDTGSLPEEEYREPGYVFTYTYVDDNGILQTAQPISKLEWNREIRYRYKSQGVYTVTLFVKNEFGYETLIFNDVLKIIDQAPKAISIDVKGPNVNSINNAVRLKALEDTADISVNLENNRDVEIIQYLWDIPNSNASDYNDYHLSLAFEYGGLYDIGVKAISKTNSWIGTYLNNALDVVERYSVYLSYYSKTRGELYLNEYSPKTNAWKESINQFNLEYSNPIISTESLQIPVADNRKDTAVHNISNTDDLYYLWSNSTSSISMEKYNSMSNSFAKELDTNFVKLCDWYSLYIPIFDVNKIYILGGLTDIYDASKNSQDIINYDIITKTFQTISQEYVINDTQSASYTYAFADAQGMTVNPNNIPAKWKTTSFAGKGYILRDSSNGFLQDFYSFDPNSNIFNTIKSTIPFTKQELGFQALANGLYVISNSGDINVYNPGNDTWVSTGPATQSRYQNMFNSSGSENTKVVCGAESTTTNASNTNLYFSYDYSLDSFGKFAIDTQSYSQLASRPALGSPTIIEQFGLAVV